MPKRTSHANRYAQLPDAFRKYLVRYLPRFGREPPQVQARLVGMILQAPSKYRQHEHYEGWASFTYQGLEKRFGRNKFKAINERLGLFHVHQDDVGRDEWSTKQSFTKAYQLTDKVTDLRGKFLQGVTRRTTDILTEDGDIQRNLPSQAVEAKGHDGHTRVGWKVRVETAIPVNEAMLKKLLLVVEAHQYGREHGITQAALFHPVPDPAYLKELRDETRMVLQMSRNRIAPGKFIHRYQQSGSGRLYAKDVNLQNTYRLVRQAALHGFYDYDIENCHYSILDQMAQEHGYVCNAVRHYLINKKKVRESLAAEFGLTVDQVKTALIALVYGARFSMRSKDALPKILGGKEMAQRVYEHPVFRALRDDVAAARSAILSGQKVFRGKIENCRGMTISTTKADTRQQLAHLLQGVESVALEAAHSLYPEQIVLLQHDGFTSTTRLDSKAIKEAMFKATGYRLEMPLGEQVMVKLDAALSSHPDFQYQIVNPEKSNADNDLSGFYLIPC